MNHPEIPPNCKFFEKTYTLDSDCDDCARALTYDKHGECIASETWCFTTRCETVCIFGEYQYVCIEHIDRDTRPLIAAVARCAWLDEADKLIRLAHDPALAYDYAQAAVALVKAEKAKVHADAWKLWGEAK